MMKKCALVIAAALLLSGCWQSKGTLYAGAVPIMPFPNGRVTEIDDKKQIQHFTLKVDVSGSYRLTGDDKGTEGFGEGFSLRFFPLAGAAHGTLLYEAVALDDCREGTRLCGEANGEGHRYYGLLLPRANGADEIRPDCVKDATMSKPFGVKSDGGTCDFQSRATLEKALRQLAKSGKKPSFFYTVR